MRLIVAFMVCSLFLPSHLFSQKKPSSGKGTPATGNDKSTTGSSDSPPGGSLESSMIAYEAMAQIARQIKSRTVKAIEEKHTAEVSAAFGAAQKKALDAKKEQNPKLTDEELNQLKAKLESDPTLCKSNKILLVDADSLSQIMAYRTFSATVENLTNGYKSAQKGSFGRSLGVLPTDYISAIAGLLTALRSTAEFSGGTFQLNKAALIAELDKQFLTAKYRLRVSSVPDFSDKPKNDVVQQLSDLYDARSSVDDAHQKSPLFTEVDKQFNDFRTSLQSVNDSGVPLLTLIIAGKALMNSLTGLDGNSCSNFHMLSVDIDAAGGASRTNHNFWVELFYTTPAPSYNGGAVVSYTLSDVHGDFIEGDTLREMYGYSKWHAPKLESHSNFDNTKP